MVGRRAILWKEQRLTVGNVSTQMLIVPNQPEALGEWGDRREGDFDFAAGTAGKLGRVVFHEAVIAQIRP